MKKYLFNISLFFLIVIIIDVLSGKLFEGLRGNARGGQTFKNEYIYSKCKDDILILGSSKADHHYVPSVLEDSLGLSCYNAGEMGCGIIPAFVRYKMVCERKKPKLVIYEVTPSYDYLSCNHYSRYLGTIRQYTNNGIVREVYIDFSDNIERFKLFSNLYRNNSKLIMNLKDIFKPKDKYKGYEPLFGTMATMDNEGNIEDDVQLSRTIDSLKLRYFERLIIETRKDSVLMICMVSPLFGPNKSNDDFIPAIDLCEKYDIPFINNMNNDAFQGNEGLFQDYTHLNHTGAIEYSKKIVSQLKPYLNK